MSKKTMPTAQVSNPSPQRAAYQDLTSALGRLASRPWEESQSSATPAIAKGIEDALAALMGEMTPEPQLMKQALYSGSARVLEDLFAAHGAEAYHAIHAETSISFSEPVKRASLDQLRVLLAHGFDLSAEAPRMIRQIRRHHNPAYLSFLRDEMGDRTRFSDTLQTDEVMGQLPDFLIPVIAEELRDTLGTDTLDYTTRGLRMLRNKMPLKYLAVLILTGRPVAQVLERTYPTTASDPVAKIVKMSTSAHGRLEIHRLEPSLEDVLARPKGSEFFGIAADEASFMIHHWPEGVPETNEDA